MISQEALIERYRALKKAEGPRVKKEARDRTKEAAVERNRHRDAMRELVGQEMFTCPICNRVLDVEYAHLYLDLEKDTEGDEWICGHCREDMIESEPEEWWDD